MLIEWDNTHHRRHVWAELLLSHFDGGSQCLCLDHTLDGDDLVIAALGMEERQGSVGCGECILFIVCICVSMYVMEHSFTPPPLSL